MDVRPPKPESRRPGFPAPRRVATAPMALQSASRRPDPSPPDSLVETLYNHPNAKIVAFTSSATPILREVGAVDGEEPGSLSPSSHLERTIAVGPFRIYRAPGSVAFLSCGSALQPILPKSQCWSIDEIDSKFVLQIRRPNYWRIELPVSDPEDQQRALIFRDVLDRVLQFEKTVCPFKRSFTVELPEPPKEPVKKKPWTPVKPPRPDVAPAEPIPAPPQQSADSGADARESFSESAAADPEVHASSDTDDVVRPEPGDSLPQEVSEDAAEGKSPLSPWDYSEADKPASSTDVNLSPWHDTTHSPSSIVVATEAARIDELAASCGPPAVPPQAATGEPPSLGASSRPPPSLESKHDTTTSGNAASEAPAEPRAEPPSMADASAESHAGLANGEPSSCLIHEGAGSRKGLMKARLRRTAGFKYAPVRAVTSPPQLSLVTSPPSKAAQRTTASDQPTEAPGNVSPTESQDSFHSVQSWHSPITPLPPSPPMSQPESPATFPYPHNNICMPRREALDRKASDMTITPGTGHLWEAESQTGSDGSRNSVATAPDNWPAQAAGLVDSESPEGDETARSTAMSSQLRGLKHRAATGSASARRRALSPLPPAANVFSPKPRSDESKSYRALETMGQIPLAIISKTCEVLLGPPSHLIALMLRVAARISAGEWRGRMDGFDDKGDRIPVQWDYSEGDFSDWSDDEDPRPDHGIVRQNSGASSASATGTGGEVESWGME